MYSSFTISQSHAYFDCHVTFVFKFYNFALPTSQHTIPDFTIPCTLGHVTSQSSILSRFRRLFTYYFCSCLITTLSHSRNESCYMYMYHTCHHNSNLIGVFERAGYQGYAEVVRNVCGKYHHHKVRGGVYVDHTHR